ncbi:MAG: HutD family protein [Rhizomicrobium sp.]
MKHIITATDRKQMPWKNGLGLTEEFAIFPPNSTLKNFSWRVSMAHVTRDSAFSPFPGVIRHMAIFEGAMRLKFADRPPRLLTRTGPIETFRGDDPVSASVVTGPVRDLNIMTRGQCTARLSRVSAGQAVSFEATTETALMIAIEPLTVSGKTDRFELLRYDALRIDRPGQQDLYAITSGDCYVVQTFPASK